MFCWQLHFATAIIVRLTGLVGAPQPSNILVTENFIVTQYQEGVTIE
jgi:hypothetical protein